MQLTSLTEEQRAQFIREGYIQVPGLIPPDLAASTRERLLAALEIDPEDPETWSGKNVVSDPRALALTEPCRTPAVEAVAQELVGPQFARGRCLSPYLEAKGLEPAIRGYIPVLNFPSPGPPEFERPCGFHIDGMHRTTLWPDHCFLIVFIYLSDVAVHGGATTVLPGSHRQVFEHWLAAGHPGSTHPPALTYAEPRPLPGRAGDAIFMHYLLVHSGSANHSARIRVGLNTAIMPDPERPYQPKSGPPGPDWTPLDWTLISAGTGPGGGTSPRNDED
jgi:phytanoyl-CoA hydroxylase